MSKYINLQREIDDSKIKEVAQIIKDGGLVIFPTETVYGIGANGLNAEAIEKIYIAKERKKDKPLILLISDKKMLNEIVKDITPVESKLMEAFWPGPLTIVLNKKSCVPDSVTAGTEKVGVRMTSGKIVQKLIEFSGVPIAAPSANISGEMPATKIEDISEELKNKVDYIIDGGESEETIASTVVRVIDEVPYILRQGRITEEQINEVVRNKTRKTLTN